MLTSFSVLAAALIATPGLGYAQQAGYLGWQVCAGCHKEIAREQASSNMARTLIGARASREQVPAPEREVEGAVRYDLDRVGEHLTWRVQLPGKPALVAPVETMMGGTRHGISFLVRVNGIEGSAIERPVLVEARYLKSAHEGGLMLSPGLPPEQPSSFETAIGRPLTREFEKKCLACHGYSPETGQKENGVRCESCHGPGQSHLAALSKGSGRTNLGIVNPGKLSADRQLVLCGRCHAGFAAIQDPLPGDLLISNQVMALKNTECYIQSGAGISCTSCHDPHHNADRDVERSQAACLSCHGLEKTGHAAVCPVNQRGGCVGCHMPSVSSGGFTMSDHWIRVHPEIPAPAHPAREEFRSEVRPVREYLRAIALKTETDATDIERRLAGGESFFDLARKYSTDPSASQGGWLGSMALTDLASGLGDAAARLRPGDASGVLRSGENFMILQRAPRNFRDEAARIEREASALRKERKPREAEAKYLEALRIYPTFLRAIVFLAATKGELGEGARALALLEYATRLYPDDASAWYNLGIAYEAAGRPDDEIAAYRRALAIEPGMTPAYLNLGATLFSSGRMGDAIEAYRHGLREDPLAARLYYSLSVALTKNGDKEGARKSLDAASKIDPEFVRRQDAR